MKKLKISYKKNKIDRTYGGSQSKSISSKRLDVKLVVLFENKNMSLTLKPIIEAILNQCKEKAFEENYILTFNRINFINLDDIPRDEVSFEEYQQQHWSEEGTTILYVGDTTRVNRASVNVNHDFLKSYFQNNQQRLFLIVPTTGYRLEERDHWKNQLINQDQPFDLNQIGHILYKGKSHQPKYFDKNTLLLTKPFLKGTTSKKMYNDGETINVNRDTVTNLLKFFEKNYIVENDDDNDDDQGTNLPEQLQLKEEKQKEKENLMINLILNFDIYMMNYLLKI